MPRREETPAVSDYLTTKPAPVSVGCIRITQTGTNTETLSDHRSDHVLCDKDITQDIQGFDKKALPYIEMYDFLKTLIT